MPRAEDDRLRLERKFEELCEQVREYPTPIARCDEQLSALIEERTRILEELKRHDH
jgi:chorismate mutase